MGLDDDVRGGDIRHEADIPIVGWRERVEFPAWGVSGVLTKIDTGACLSALHVVDITPHDPGRVGFRVALDRKLTRLSDELEAPIARETRIRSSNGQLQRRFVVDVQMALGEHRKWIEVSLVNRKSMRCRMLLGREALADSFLVDPAREYLLTKRPEKAGGRRRERGGAGAGNGRAS